MTFAPQINEEQNRMSDLFPTRRRSTPGRFPDVDTMVTRLKPSYPVYCLKPSRLADAARTFIEGFPGEVLYAVKCNPERAVISTLYEAGIAGFDVASLAEVALVADLFEEAELHFHHPIKSRAAIANAYRVYGVERFAVDHADELAKIHAETRGGPVVMMVRLTTDSSRSTYDLSAKFGASVPEAAAMMREAHRLGHQVGLYFHVGSQCPDPQAYDEAMAVVRAAMDHAPEVPVVALDVGGGFPGRYDMGVEMPPVGDYFAAVRRALDTIPPLPGRRILCEPGRALVADGLSLVVQVHLRKGDRLFINDGIYGSLSETVTGQLRFPARAIRPAGPLDAERQPFTIFGPTCDSTDVLPAPLLLPSDIREGDWIEIDMIGAYSNALATRFNGFLPEAVVEIGEPAARAAGSVLRRAEAVLPVT
ncbi:type III PLP-dependent enzyme [Tistrella mobilis]|uniref:ornithine decarboxylase n=2 Tax=Tistrella mobilis TaxID=171437 RepID=I3TL15_TISMK|nr:type III PLP-dependent enzyme [Tistrella mobilis]AFK53453.1 ornithine decarboxylase [Tistrella mobilis KA081020-065]